MEDLFKYYNQNKEYFKLTERGHTQGGLFPIYKDILSKCKNKKGLIVDLGYGTGLDILSMTGQNNCLGIGISQFIKYCGPTCYIHVQKK